MNLTDIMADLLVAKHNSQSAYEVYKACKETENSLREELMETLNENQLKSAKDASTGTTATIATKIGIDIKDEKKVIDWIKNQPTLDADLYIGLIKSRFEGIAKTWLQQSGELVPGTELQEIEYLTVKEKH